MNFYDYRTIVQDGPKYGDSFLSGVLWCAIKDEDVTLEDYRELRELIKLAIANPQGPPKR